MRGRRLFQLEDLPHRIVDALHHGLWQLGQWSLHEADIVDGSQLVNKQV